MDKVRIFSIITMASMILMSIITLLGSLFLSYRLVGLVGLTGAGRFLSAIAVTFTWVYCLLSLPVFKKAVEYI